MPSAMHPHLLHLTCGRPWLSSTHFQPCVAASRLTNRDRVPTHRRFISQTTQRRSDESPKPAGSKVQRRVGLVYGHYGFTGTIGSGNLYGT